MALLFATFAIAENSGRLAGIVIDLAGSPIADASVILRRSSAPGFSSPRPTAPLMSARTGPDGAFHIDAIPPGEYDIQIGSPGFQSFAQHNTEIKSVKTIKLGRVTLGVGSPCTTSVPYQPPSIGLRALPSGRTRVSGYGYDPPESTRTQLAGISVVLKPLKKNQNLFRTKADDQGRFVFDSVLPGSYSLRASLPGRAAIVVDQVPVKAGQETIIERFPMEKCRLFIFCRTHTRFRQSFVCE